MKTLKAYLVLAASAGTLVAAGAPAQAAVNLLTNGSFETDSFTGWTQSGNLGLTLVVSGANGPVTGAQDGTFYVQGGPVGSFGLLSQSFSDNPGSRYTVSGWMASDGATPNDFGMSVGASGISLKNVAAQGWTNYSFSFVGSGSDTLTLNFRNDPGFMYMDNFSVSSVSSTPGPVPGAGLAGLAALALAGLYARTRHA